VKAEATKRAIEMATRAASNNNGNGDGGKINGNGNKGAGWATTRAMAPLPTKTVINALSITAKSKTRQTSVSYAAWTTTGEQTQLLMILTITAQCRSKGTIAPSASKNCMETQIHSPKQKNLGIFQTPRELRHSKTNEQSGFNAEQIKRMNIRIVKPFEE
jgi:hypothetical protein